MLLFSFLSSKNFRRHSIYPHVSFHGFYIRDKELIYMAIKEKSINIVLSGQNISHLEKLKYDLPRTIDRRGRLVIPKGSTLEVLVDDLMPSSKETITRICDECGDQTNDIPYALIVRIRNNGDGLDRCGKCSSKIRGTSNKNNVKYENSLEFKRPTLAVWWNKVLNSKTPNQVSYGSNFKYWWVCPKCSSDYQCSIKERNRGIACPYCAGLLSNHTNSLESNYPDLMKEWNCTKNIVDPSQLAHTSSNKVWWVCEYGHEWETGLRNRTIMNTKCPECCGNKKKDTKTFKSEVFELVGEEYSVVGEYINTITSIYMLHNTCANKYFVTPANFIRGTRCPKCHGGVVISHEEFLNIIYELVSEEYVVKSKYINSQTKIKLIHNICKMEWEVVPNNFINSGSRCPFCSRTRKSKGSMKVRKFLIDINAIHKEEYRLSKCRDKNALPFDFAVFNNYMDVVLLIEYDGEQHFEPARYSDDKKVMLAKLKKTQEHDQIKTDYCLNNNIPLVRIPYWDFDNIESILIDECIKLGILENVDQVS
jgi:hypothetical protein